MKHLRKLRSSSSSSSAKVKFERAGKAEEHDTKAEKKLEKRRTSLLLNFWRDTEASKRKEKKSPQPLSARRGSRPTSLRSRASSSPPLTGADKQLLEDILLSRETAESCNVRICKQLARRERLQQQLEELTQKISLVRTDICTLMSSLGSDSHAASTSAAVERPEDSSQPLSLDSLPVHRRDSLPVDRRSANAKLWKSKDLPKDEEKHQHHIAKQDPEDDAFAEGTESTTEHNAVDTNTTVSQLI